MNLDVPKVVLWKQFIRVVNRFFQCKLEGNICFGDILQYFNLVIQDDIELIIYECPSLFVFHLHP